MSGATLTRRILLSSGALAAAGLALSGCGRNGAIDLELTTDTSFAFFDRQKANILMDVADLLIPRSDTVGAADTDTVLYLDQLMRTWAGETTKTEISGFTDVLDLQAERSAQSGYLDLPQKTRVDLLREIDRASFSETDETGFAATYRRLKWLIFHIHYTSEAANPDFVLIPGQYRGNISEAEYAALVEDNRY